MLNAIPLVNALRSIKVADVTPDAVRALISRMSVELSSDEIERFAHLLGGEMFDGSVFDYVMSGEWIKLLIRAPASGHPASNAVAMVLTGTAVKDLSSAHMIQLATSLGEELTIDVAEALASKIKSTGYEGSISSFVTSGAALELFGLERNGDGHQAAVSDEDSFWRCSACGNLNTFEASDGYCVHCGETEG